MTSKDNTEDRAPREATLGPLLDRLNPVRLQPSSGASSKRIRFSARPMRSRDHSCGNWSMRTLLPRLKTKYERWITEDLNARAAVTSGATSSPRRLPGRFLGGNCGTRPR